jgi:hypothetical protein
MSTAARQTKSRFGMTCALAMMLALLTGLLLTGDAGAWAKKAYTSIGVRNQAQSDLCDVSGGSFESETETVTNRNGKTSTVTTTTCTGGKNPQTCVNTQSMTSCSQALIVIQPLDESAVGESQIGGVQTLPEPTVIVDNGAVTGPIAPVSVDGTGAETAEPTEEAGGDEGPIVDVVLDDVPEINDSVSTGDETQLPVKQLEPIQFDGLPTR